MDNPVLALILDQDNNLYAGGLFTQAGGIPANNIARWNGSSWSVLGGSDHGTNGYVKTLAFGLDGGLDFSVAALVAQPNGMAAGGAFQRAGAFPSTGIAFWVIP
jgi:hypothetical protein